MKKKTTKEVREDAEYRKFWASIKNYNPPFYHLLALAKQKEVRLLAICAAALVKLVMEKQKKEISKKRKPSAWQLFAGSQLRAGKSIKDAAELWKKQNPTPTPQ